MKDHFGLVLSRHIGEKIYIGKDGEIVITVIGIDRGKLRLAIDAPKDVLILRSELLKGTDHESRPDS